MRRRLLVGGLFMVGVAVAGCFDDGPTSSKSSAGPGIGPAIARPGEPLAETKFLIEHNATDEDTGYQLFVDGEPWNRLTVVGPGGGVVEIDARGAMRTFGLTEGFFETNEPPNDEVPIEDVLALFPEGTYDFAATSVADGSVMRGEAILTHTIPAEPQILTPQEGAQVDPSALVISWNPVEQSIFGEPIELDGYQVIVVEENDLPPTQSFFKSELSVFVPPSTTRITIPAEFLESKTTYEVEVLAIERSGNQTIGLRVFETI